MSTAGVRKSSPRSNSVFPKLVDSALESIGKRGKRVYKQTYDLWEAWCTRRQIDPINLDKTTISKFLISQKVTYNTRRRYLSALRKLALTAVEADPADEARQKSYAQLLQLRVPERDLIPTDRKLHELKPLQAESALDAWSGETPIQLRNRALVALLFMTGLRRSEVNILRQADIDLDNGTVGVPHEEKPELSRTIAIPGDTAIQAMSTWLAVLGPTRVYAFPSIRRSGILGPDKPMTDQAVYTIIQKTQTITGIVFTPQDARRTFLTEALDNGSPIADVQKQAGHRDILSTLKYAKSPEAVQMRKRLKLRYGSSK